MTESDAIAWCDEHKVTIRFEKRSVRIEADPKGLLLGKGETLLQAFQDLQVRHEPARMALINLAEQAFHGWLMSDPRSAAQYDEAYGESERWAAVIKAIVRHLKSNELPACFLEE